MRHHTYFSRITLWALLAGVLAFSGCNTWHGAGKDVEKTGEAMQ
jgi:predicted small secreted protein